MVRFGAAEIKITLIVLSYFTVSILLVFANKFLLSSEGASIPAPCLVTWFQCVFTAALIYALGLAGETKRSTPSHFLNEFPLVNYRPSTAMSVFPLSFMFVCMMTFNNLCLKYVEVSFYNVARSLTIVANVILSFFLLGERTSARTLSCLLIVIVGFFVGADGEINFSLIGTLFGVLSSCFVSLNAIYTKKSMSQPGVDNDKWKLAYYNNMNASFMFAPIIILAGEHHIIMQYFDLLYSSFFWSMMVLAGLLGFLIGIVTVMQITHTSPLTHNISGTVKACVQSLLALLIWRNPTTVQAMFGLFMTIFGSCLYTLVRMRENDAKRSLAVSSAAGTTSRLPTSGDSHKGERGTQAERVGLTSNNPLVDPDDRHQEAIVAKIQSKA